MAAWGGKGSFAEVPVNGGNAPIAAIRIRGIERAGSTRNCHFAPTRHSAARVTMRPFAVAAAARCDAGFLGSGTELAAGRLLRLRLCRGSISLLLALPWR